MDPHFTQITRTAIAKGIKNLLALKAQQLLELTNSPTFETDFYGDPGTPTVDELTDFKTFYDEVVVQGWTFMKTTADTPEEIEQAFAYLSERGVSFEGGAP